ncbi:MAG: ABC transporter permease [Candidatus Omnitrophica bacterium]|nr:ABC transporter permease [Candidatus Omnitrophota bacterium]
MKIHLSNFKNSVVSFVEYAGGLTLLLFRTIFCLFTPPFKKGSVVKQANKIGADAVPVVFLIAGFTGVVLALQMAYLMRRINSEIYIASLVSVSMARELGPVFTGLVVAGRTGASITAEIGTMKVTEQIDALQTLAVNPIKYLVVPRFLASLLVVPLLTVYANFIGILGSSLVGIYKLGIGRNMYFRMAFKSMLYKDFFSGLIKAFVFAGIISLVACYAGFRAKGGAEGVGKATTASVVISFILIIVANCLLTAIFYFLFP